MLPRSAIAAKLIDSFRRGFFLSCFSCRRKANHRVFYIPSRFSLAFGKSYAEAFAFAVQLLCHANPSCSGRQKVVVLFKRQLLHFRQHCYPIHCSPMSTFCHDWRPLSCKLLPDLHPLQRSQIRRLIVGCCKKQNKRQQIQSFYLFVVCCVLEGMTLVFTSNNRYKEAFICLVFVVSLVSHFLLERTIASRHRAGLV